MQRLATTVIALVGRPEAVAAAAEHLDDQANVAVVPTTGDPVGTWARVVRSRSPWTAIADDPLADVAAAWDDTFAGSAPHGRLEVAGQELADRVRAGAVDLPDVYLHVAEGAREEGAPSFHLAVLHPLAPSRVVPAAPAGVARAVGRLRGGRWWPAVDQIVRTAAVTLPDQAGVAGDGVGDGDGDGGASLLTG